MSHDPQTKHPASDSLQGADYETSQFPLNNTADVPEIQADGVFSRLNRIGFNPIPLVHGKKDAAVKWKHYQTTRATDTECAAWDAGTYNMGIITGAISGVFVVDVDGAVGEATLASLEAEHGALPETVRAKSGKGWHFYFPYPTDGRVIRNLAGQSVHGEVLENVDIRGAGGYIAAPPSLHPNGIYYEWENSPFDMPPAPAPDWLLELVVQPEKPAFILSAPTRNQDVSAYLQAALEGELNALHRATEGQRNNALNKAAYSLGQLVAHGLDAGRIASELLQVASSIGLNGQEAITTIASGIEAGKQTPRILPTLPLSPNNSNNAWEAPVRFDDITTPPIPPQLLPEPLCEFIQAVALATETPVEMGIACALAVASVAVTGKYEVSPRNGWTESLNTYWFVELPPANRKSTVVKTFTAPLVAWEEEQANLIKPEIARAKSLRNSELKRIEKLRKQAVDEKDSLKREALMKDVADMDTALDANPLPTLPRLFSNNVTPESLENETNDQGGGFAVISDEGGVVETLTGLYTNGKANTDIILKGIDGGEMRIKRKDRDIQMRPYLTFLLVVQPRIREKMGENPAMQGNGTLERFLYLIPKSTIGYRTHTTPPVTDALKESYYQLIGGLLALPYPTDAEGSRTTPECLIFDMEGQHAILTFQQWLEPQLKKGGACYALQGWGGKIAGFIARMAGLLHLVETQGRTLTIPLATVENAISLGKGLLEHAKVTFALMKLDEAVRDASEVSLWITETAQSSFSRTILTTAMRHTMDAKRIDAAMGELEARHLIRTREKQGKGTKPVKMYDVNPAFLIQTT